MDQHVCPWWFAYTFDNPLRSLVHPAQKILKPYIRPGMTVMDIGCGMGHFSLELARQVGPEGRVVAVDLQEKMLQRMCKRAQHAGLLERIMPHLSKPDNLDLQEQADFILTFWMVHEVPEVRYFLTQLHDVICAGGKWLVVEPKAHTSRERFEQLLEQAGKTGFQVVEHPAIRLSYAAIMERLP